MYNKITRKQAFESVITLFILLLSSFALNAQSTIYFSNKGESNYIGKHLSVFTDSSSRMTIDDILRSTQLFKEQTEMVPNFGVTHASAWLKFNLVNTSEHRKILLSIEYPPLDGAELYVVNGNQVRTQSISPGVSINTREYRHQYYVFDLGILPGDSATCYLKLSSNSQLLAPIKLNTTASFLTSISNSDVLSGLYVGIMLVMIFYNLFVYFSARDKYYLLYVQYIFWVLMAQVTLLGFDKRFLWSENLWLSQHAMLISAAMSGVATIIFVKSFLETAFYARKLTILLNVMLAADILAIILQLFGFDLLSYNMVNAIAGLGAISIFITACIVFSRKRRPANFFLAAWTIFLLGVLVFVLKDFGIFDYNFFTVHSMQIGSAIEAVLLSFALADRINVLKMEKDKSQLAALRIAKENTQIIREQNVMLETKVKERTEELVYKNEELNETLEDLKQTQIQLVESEKMASLGQLTAGIAHEINNPINFVTGNIKPLKRDVTALFDTIDMMEKLNSSGLSDNERNKEIHAYMEELDFDYLKIEINHLLNGISDGATRTAEIVKSLRIFSRLDEDDLKAADVNQGLDSTIVIVNNQVKNIEVVRDYEQMPPLVCYPGKLNQVFLNIISNGVFAIKEKFGDEPGGKIEIVTKTEGDHVSIRISDNGTGMSAETKRKVFDPFFTTKDVGQGTGLGMSIVFNTIQKHKGQILVESILGEGSVFTILLPLNLEI